jgi:hypothetical protein
MRTIHYFTALLGLALIASPLLAADAPRGFKQGAADLKSAGPLAFGPGGVLFIADPAASAVFAIETGDTTNPGPATYKMSKVDDRISGLLGTTAGEIDIKDVVVNPSSAQVYFSVARGKGPQAPPVILRLNRQGEFSEVSLKDVKYAKAELPDPSPAPSSAPTASGRPRMRAPAITGLAFVDGKLYVAALSNEEFSSTFRAIPFPFTDVAKGTTVEIYHGSHGRLETNSPIRSFTSYEIAGNANLLAAYTCTPLVKIPVTDLKPGAKIKGTTVAELGNRNTPLDMIVYRKGGEDYLLMINDNRGVMKIDLEKIGTIDGINAQISGTAGLPYTKVDNLNGVVQMSRLDADHAVVLVKADSGLNLETIELP